MFFNKKKKQPQVSNPQKFKCGPLTGDKRNIKIIVDTAGAPAKAR